VTNIWRQLILDTIFVRCPEWRFDWKWGVRTAGVIPAPDSPNGPHVYSEKYQATPPDLFRDMMRSLDLDPSRFLFFDMGCGKGKALLLASEYPFRGIVGVELLPCLAAIAERNLDRCDTSTRRCANIQVVRGNAAEFAFPDQNAVVFFYNPFKKEVLGKVLDGVRQSICKTSERYILYLDPAPGHSLDDAGSLSLIHRAQRFSVYRMMVPTFDQQGAV
jgi:SAM-dependent methyltransferase